MSLDDEKELIDDGIAFQEPDTAARLSTGVGRDWPEARGVFVTEGRELAVWINEDDHLRLISGLLGGDLRKAFERFCTIEDQLNKALAANSQGFARHEKYGFLSTDLGNLGT